MLARRGNGAASALPPLMRSVSEEQLEQSKASVAKARPCAMFTLKAPGLFTEPGAELYASGTPERSS